MTNSFPTRRSSDLPLHGEAGARRDEGEGEAQNRGRHPGEDGQHQRVPGDAAGIGADEAVEPPDPAVGHAREEGAERVAAVAVAGRGRSEEHPSELQSLMRISYAVFCLKKKTT